MKSYAVLPLLATAALAQSQADGPNCGIITNPPLDDDYPAGTRVIAVALTNINGSTVALNQSIDAFDGSLPTIVNLQNSAAAVLANIQSGNTNVSVIPANDDSDQGQLATFALVTYVGGLACTVNATADNLINSKQALVDACVGPIVLQNAQQQQSDSLTFEATVKSKLSPSLQDLSDSFVAPINVALSSAVSAFADQTALPASCSSTTTSSVTTTTTGSVTTTTTTGGNGVDPILTGTGSTTRTGTATGTGIVGPGGTILPTGGNGWAPYGQPVPTGGAQPQPPTNGGDEYEDCEEDYPTQVDDEEDCDDEEDPTGDAGWQPVSGQPGKPNNGPGSQPGNTWEAVPAPSGGSPPAGPTGSVVKPNGPSGNNPVGNPTYPASSGWQPVYSGKPTGTGNGTIPKYTGAAVAKVANGMGAAAIAAMAAVAML